MPQEISPQTGEAGWGGPPQRRPEAAYEQTGAMAAQPYPGPQQPGPQQPAPRAPEPGRRQAVPREPGRRQSGREGAPRTGGDSDTRARSNQETMVSDAPRRARGRGSGGPQGPGGPGGPEGPEKPRDERPKWRRFIPSWKIVMASMTVLAAGIFGMIAVAYVNTPVPDENDTQAGATSQGSTVYYADGKTVIAKLGTPRKIIKIGQMDKKLQDATVAIENDTFYEDSGISISGMARSLWMTATGQQLQGASTITQQMARGYYGGLSSEVSIKRKVSEIFIAVKLNQTKSKEVILQTYLNTVNFGRAYGVEAAAEAYFGKGKHASNLTLSQAAYLAAHIQTPSWDSEAPELKYRWKTVLEYMAKQWPDKYAEDAKTATWPKIRKANSDNSMGGLNGYMIDAVKRELKGRGITEDVIESSGYQIVTTFDRKLMQAAKTAVLGATSGMSKEFHTGLAAVDPNNGRVVAFYGGTNYLKDPWNEPFDSAKQAASAFKPYVLAAWLKAGYSIKSYVPGSVTVPEKLPGQQLGGFKNSHNVGASIDVVKATAQSVNTAYVSMAFALPGKIEDVKDLVEAAGFSPTRMDTDLKEHSYQFAIGSAPVTPVEQAAGYSIFANGGLYTKYHVVKEIKLNNKTAYPELKSPKRVISAEAAADATVAMQEVLRSGTAAGKGLGNRPAAGKTGTNNEEKEAWFVGYTPQLSTAVGMYREICLTKTGKRVQPINSNCPITPGGKPHKKYNINKPYTTPKETTLGFEGADTPTTIWRAFMTAALQNKPVEQFPDRSDIGQPENIVPSPTPTPTPTEDPSLDDEDPNANCGVVPPCTDDQIITVDPNENGTPQQDDGGGFDGRGSQGANPAMVPQPTTTRREDW
ncbi:transglycosylase domain-containing protein [Nonomuraea sp. NEAU-A123]|uniref:transglycosylase domain-containing protein n=1 Tax=Nonomuraea sp. NEAU-A123 TaxID=2839649 RepID=UPI001BE443C7|nr:transglycosylase domain-containing protein [Nonomuraea sp. NEAU-A123]MBT2226352.1 penicillin-binding protein [Nonomuraea sp. NEAU-A123]